MTRQEMTPGGTAAATGGSMQPPVAAVLPENSDKRVGIIGDDDFGISIAVDVAGREEVCPTPPTSVNHAGCHPDRFQFRTRPLQFADERISIISDHHCGF